MAHEKKNGLIKKILISFLLLTGLAFGQIIHLTGTVKTQNGTPIPAASVTLVGRNLSTVTSAQGTYEIINVLNSINKITPRSKSIQLRGNRLEIALLGPENVNVSIYDLDGRKQKQLLNVTSPGDMEYSNPVEGSMMAEIQILRVKVGENTQSFKIINTVPAVISVKIESPGLRKASNIIDELEVVSEGYFKKRVTLIKYIDTLDIVLQKVVTGPNIIFKDMFLAYDTITVGNIFQTVPMDRGNKLLLNLKLENVGTENALSVTCSLSTADPYITITSAISGFNNIGMASDTLSQKPYSISVSNSITPARAVLFQLYIKDSWGGSWRDSCVYVVNPFVIESQNIDDDDSPDSKGNGNGLIDPSEIIEYTPRIQNKSEMVITDVHVLLLSKQTNVTVWNTDKIWRFGDFKPEQKKLPEWDYVMAADETEFLVTANFDLLIMGKINGKKEKWLLPFSLPFTAVAPTIITHPTPTIVIVGQTAVFSVTASSTAPLSYQWQKDNVNINGATSSSYTTPATSMADNAMKYRCVVSNSAGSVTSNAAILTVMVVAPRITTHPTPTTVIVGQTAVFSVTAFSTAPLSYQWQKDNVNINGATSSSYTTPATSMADNATTYRCVVSKSVGSVTSNAATLRIWTPGSSVTDADGNEYTTILIGNQVWTVENLRTTKYNDDTPIPHVTGNIAWDNLTTPGYSYYDNDSASNAEKYGALYNWYAVDTKKLAPTGWHVPSYAEWTELEEYLVANGYNWDGTTSGNKIAKSMAAQTDWISHTRAGSIGNDLSKNNASGFSALPGGYRYHYGVFDLIGSFGYWWSATEYDAGHAWRRNLNYDGGHLSRGHRYKGAGLSVRLLRD